MTGLFLPGHELLRKSRVPDGQGGHAETYEVVGMDLRGRLSPVSAAESERAHQVVGVVTHRFSTGVFADVRVDDRIRRSGVTATVKAVRRTSQGRRLECLCEEVRGA